MYHIEISDRTDATHIAQLLGGTNIEGSEVVNFELGDLNNQVALHWRDPGHCEDWSYTEWDVYLNIDQELYRHHFEQVIDVAFTMRALDDVRRGAFAYDSNPLFLWQGEQVWFNRSTSVTADLQSWVLQALRNRGVEPIMASYQEIDDNKLFTPEPFAQRHALAHRRVDAHFERLPTTVDDESVARALTPADQERAAWAAVHLEQRLHRYAHLDHIAELATDLNPLLNTALGNTPTAAGQPLTTTTATIERLSSEPHRNQRYPHDNPDLADTLDEFRTAYGL
ncbi:MAG: hypothetical protein AAGD35_19615 [Actinomycetota bacterium]